MCRCDPVEHNESVIGKGTNRCSTWGMRWRTLSTLLFCLVMAGIVLWIWLQPAPVFRVSMSFAGYTNDAAGIRRATFAVTNRGTMTIRRWDFCDIEAWQSGSSSELHVGPDAYLTAGQGEVIALPKLTNDTSWRVTFYFSPDGWRRKAKDVQSSSRFLSWIVPDRLIPALPVENHIRSDWITP